MNKLTSVSAILRSEVKGQVEFDLLVAVCRAIGMPLAEQAFDKLDEYNGQYFAFDYPEVCLQDKDLLIGGNELISFEDAVFSLAKPEWTHIWQGNTTKHFFYGNREDIRFNISISKTASAFNINKYTIIATRDPQVVEPPKTKFAVGDYVERINTNYMSINIGDIAVVRHVDETHRLFLDGYIPGFDKKNFKLAIAPKKPKFAVGDVIRRNEGDIDHEVLFMDDRSMLLQALLSPMRSVIHDPCFEDFTRVIPIREQIITVLDDQDYCSAEHADRLLKLFNVTQKS